MACEVVCHVDVFAAAGFVSGASPRVFPCNDTPLPAVGFHGTDDNSLPYNGDAMFLPVLDWDAAMGRPQRLHHRPDDDRQPGRGDGPDLDGLHRRRRRRLLHGHGQGPQLAWVLDAARHHHARHRRHRRPVGHLRGSSTAVTSCCLARILATISRIDSKQPEEKPSRYIPTKRRLPFVPIRIISRNSWPKVAAHAALSNH